MEFEAAAVSISRQVLAKYITPGCTFIETGTRWGDTCIRAAELGATTIYTVEADPLMRAVAQVHLFDALPRFGTNAIISGIGACSPEWLGFQDNDWEWDTRRVVFLDAHTENTSPLLEEVRILLAWKKPPSVILMDDRRLWSGWGIEESAVKQLCVDMGATEWKLEDGAMHPNDIAVAVWK